MAKPDKIISVQQQDYLIERRYNVVYEDSNGKQYTTHFVPEAILNYQQKILELAAILTEEQISELMDVVEELTDYRYNEGICEVWK